MEPKTLLELGASRPLPTCNEPSALAVADLDVALDLLQVRSGVDRSHLRRPFERIADADPFRLSGHALHDFLIDRVVDEQAAGGAA